MRRLGALSLAILFALPGCSETEPADCLTAVAGPETGFGAPGPHGVRTTGFENPAWPGQRVFLALPANGVAPAPTVVLAHAYDTADPNSYRALIEHLASRGHAVVFPQYMVASGRHRDRYAALWSGVEEAVRRHRPRLDLDRFGIVGHSYGAGAIPFLLRRALVDEGWGGRGAFAFPMAPWYPQQIEPAELRALPEHLKVVVQVFEEDRVNDHRIAIALFQALGVPASEKDYVVLRSSANAGCSLPAVHTVPQSRGLRAQDDALDTWGVLRLIDALAAYAFQGDDAGRRVALGHGAPEQVEMGRWPDGTPLTPLQWSAEPAPVAEQSRYLFPMADAEGWARDGEPTE